MQPELRRSAWLAHDLDVPPEDALRVTGAEGLHGRLLRREAAREMNCRIVAPPAVRHFGLGEDAMREAFAVSLDGRGNARDVDGVEPETDDVHASQA